MRYTISEIRKMLGVTHMAVWKWLNADPPKLKGYQMVDGGQWWIEEKELAAHCAKMGLDWDALKARHGAENAP